MVQESIEREFKCQLTEEGYDKLRGVFGGSPKTQINHYFDNDERSLTQTSTTLRVREKGGELLLQLKIEIDETGKRELQERIDEKEFDELKNGEFSFPGNFVEALKSLVSDMRDLKYLGSMQTNRITHPANAVLGEWALDHSVLPSGEHDYELELEYAEHYRWLASRRFGEILKNNGVENRPSCMSKFERFIHDLNQRS